MRIIKPNFEEMVPTGGVRLLRHIDKSEEKVTEDIWFKFVRKLVKNNPLSMVELTLPLSVKFTVDRGVSHEIVHSRLFPSAQESTRHCNHDSDHITFICPCWFKDSLRTIDDVEFTCSEEAKVCWDGAEVAWVSSMLEAEKTYKQLINTFKWSPQQAHSVLPTSLKTEIIVTGTVRDWRQFFELEAGKSAHPQMREIAQALLTHWQEKYPVIFEGL